MSTEPKSLTSEQWTRIEMLLRELYMRVRLVIDGYAIDLMLVRDGVYRNVVLVTINGEIGGKWLFEDCDERRSFMQRTKRHVISGTKRAEFIRAVGKRYAKKSAMLKPYDSFNSGWKSFRALKKHLVANNQSIELLEDAPCK